MGGRPAFRLLVRVAFRAAFSSAKSFSIEV
jgi:hypothetical protein